MAYINECCNADFIIIDNPCNNVKQIVKASSSPSPLYVYKDNVLIGKGEVVTIGEEYLCEDYNEFLIVSQIEKDCGCDGTDYPPCYEEQSIVIPRQSCLCEGSFSFSHSYCVDTIYPFIDYHTSKFFKQERWNIVKNVETTFIFQNPCIRTSLYVFNREEQEYVEIDYRREHTIIFQLVKGGEVLEEVSITLPDNFTDEDLANAISNLSIVYTFEEKGKYELVGKVINQCGEREIKKEIFVSDEIELYVKEDCRLYDIIICDEVFEIKIREIGKEIYLAEITFDNGIITGNTNTIYLTDELDLYFGLEDGVYEISITNGLIEKKFIVVHFCQAKNCYINLTKKLYCNEAIVNERFMYNVVSFYMLYKFVIEYYTLMHPIDILETTLSNSDNLKYVEIHKALQKIKEICNECGSLVNEEDINDCGCFW